MLREQTLCAVVRTYSVIERGTYNVNTPTFKLVKFRDVVLEFLWEYICTQRMERFTYIFWLKLPSSDPPCNVWSRSIASNDMRYFEGLWSCTSCFHEAPFHLAYLVRFWVGLLWISLSIWVFGRSKTRNKQENEYNLISMNYVCFWCVFEY